MEKFEKLLGKDSPLLKTIKARGFEAPSEIQEKAIPLILEGKDVIGGASTGSGKTLAFAVGLIKNAVRKHGIRGLVLTPTRELAEQISKEIAEFSGPKDLEIIAVYGGVNMERQVRLLETADIVIGTPGRILDHINKRTINLSHVNTLVLDEADRMLDMGFRDDVIRIVSECPNERQTMLFSATISPDITFLSKRHMKDPIEVNAQPHVDPTKLEQVYYDVDNSLKYSLLKHLLESEKSNLVMVFCNTRKNVDFIVNNLKFMGIESLPLHGGYSQEKRTKMIADFHAKKVNILVATDVAARGLDIKGVTHIYNYDSPKSEDEYTHRIGRTARAGKEGKVINLVSSRDYENFQNVMQSDFNIKKEETPELQRTRIRWMPERREERNQRRSGQGGFRGGGSRGGGGGGRGRSGSGGGGRSSGGSRSGTRSGGGRSGGGGGGSGGSYGRSGSRSSSYGSSGSRSRGNSKSYGTENRPTSSYRTDRPSKRPNSTGQSRGQARRGRRQQN
ncbi:MAG: DEAD/DEAH box helicase [archaeon]